MKMQSRDVLFPLLDENTASNVMETNGLLFLVEVSQERQIIQQVGELSGSGATQIPVALQHRKRNILILGKDGELEITVAVLLGETFNGNENSLRSCCVPGFWIVLVEC